MTRPWCWLLLAACSAAWLVFALSVAPEVSGTDVFIFRDAGWNLASTGSFVSGALPYTLSLAPRLYSHYTPLFPLFFALFLTIFPKNPYAGTVFNLLLGIIAAALTLVWVRRQPPTWYRAAASASIAILPIAFVTGDRPESLGFILFSIAIAAAARPKTPAAIVGLLVAIAFLAHPFAGICSAVWIAALALPRFFEAPPARLLALKQIAIVVISAALPLAAVALIYYRIDPGSLWRFGQHSLGAHSGLGVTINPGSKTRFAAALHKGFFISGILTTFLSAMSIAAALLLAAWLLARWRTLSIAEKLAAAAGLACMAISLVAFPSQFNYLIFLGAAIPVALLIASKSKPSLGTPALWMLLVFFCAHIPSLVLAEIRLFEERASFRAARNQPALLLSHLHSRASVVAVSSSGYDLFKPSFDHLVDLDYLSDIPDRSALAGIAVCYIAFPGDADTLAPLPPYVDPPSFELIQRAPQHLWITAFGHRIMQRQWGYGCDLYIGRPPSASER